ncbi:MAG: tail fiber domain-containing protein, partial [Microbacteriaceae bacterium]|nr:tail fiber domain-containing protein [Microbacteriaceae bacterium]
LEIGYGTVNASRTALQSYNRTGSAWLGADYNALDHRFYISGGGSPQMTLTSTGLGIGTAAPLASIEITGSGECMRIQSTTAGSNYITHKHNSSGDIAYIGAAGGGALSSGANTDYAIRANQGALLFGTNGNNERARIDSSGRLLVGTSSARSIGTQSSVIQNEGTNEGTSFATTGASFCANRNDIYGSYITFGKTRGTSIGSNTIVSSGDDLGGLIFSGGDGTDVNSQAAYILCQVDGTPGVDDMPGRLVFSTTADGLSTPTERARITQKGAFKATNTGSYINTAANYHEFINGVNDTVSVYIKSTATNGQQYGLLVETANDQNDGTRYFVQCIGGVTERATIRSNGGIANYSANNVNLSDRNVKKDIAPAAGTWDCLKEWEIVNFRYKDQPDDADISMGVIAQQVAESCPEMITVFQEAKEATETEPAQEKRIGVKEQQMMWMAIKAFQEAQLRIETLEAANAELTARVSALEPG